VKCPNGAPFRGAQRVPSLRGYTQGTAPVRAASRHVKASVVARDVWGLFQTDSVCRFVRTDFPDPYRDGADAYLP